MRRSPQYTRFPSIKNYGNGSLTVPETRAGCRQRAGTTTTAGRGPMGRAGGILKQFLFTVVVLFNRIKSFFQHSASLHHARFAALHELSMLLTDRFDEPSLLLGVSRFNHLLRVQPTKTRRELGNLLIVAPTRAGKGLLATSQLLTWPHSVIVNDIKGELYTQTAGYRATIGK